MNPVQQHAPSSEELRLEVVEQALADSIAIEIETQKTLSLLTDGFQLLRELVQTHIPLCTPSMDITPVWSTPTRQPLSPASPDEFDGDQTKGEIFLTSCQTYIQPRKVEDTGIGLKEFLVAANVQVHRQICLHL